MSWPFQVNALFLATILCSACSGEPERVGTAPSAAAKQRATQPSLRSELRLPEKMGDTSPIDLCVVLTIDTTAAMLERRTAHGNLRDDGRVATVEDGALNTGGRDLAEVLKNASENLEAPTFVDCLALGFDERLPASVFVQLGKQLATAKWRQITILTRGAKGGTPLALAMPTSDDKERLMVVVGPSGITELNGMKGDHATLRKQFDRVIEYRETPTTYLKVLPGTTFGQLYPVLASFDPKIHILPVDEFPVEQEKPSKSLFDEVVFQKPVAFKGPKTEVSLSVCAGPDGKVVSVNVAEGVAKDLVATIDKTAKTWRFSTSKEEKRCGTTKLMLGQ